MLGLVRDLSVIITGGLTGDWWEVGYLIRFGENLEVEIPTFRDKVCIQYN